MGSDVKLESMTDDELGSGNDIELEREGLRLSKRVRD